MEARRLTPAHDSSFSDSLLAPEPMLASPYPGLLRWTRQEGERKAEQDQAGYRHFEREGGHAQGLHPGL